MLSCGQSVIRIAPPLSISKSEVDEGLRMFEEALTQAEKETKFVGQGKILELREQRVFQKHSK